MPEGWVMSGGVMAALVLALLVVIVIAKTAVVVPQQSAYVVERLGRYSSTLSAGFHLLVPFLDAIRYRHSLKEDAMDIPEQICITRDNVQVSVDGILYLKVLNPERASYGIGDYRFAITQLAQTTLRSEIGKIELDRTFEMRTNINTQVVNELDKASEPWGVKVLRYEIRNITPPKDILAAMEKQMRAEREKRAVILTSEGDRDAAINEAEGQKQKVIKASEAKKQQQINEAEGAASAILAIADATAQGIRKVAESIQVQGGYEAVQLRVAEQYIGKFGELAKASNTLGPSCHRLGCRLNDRSRHERHRSETRTACHQSAGLDLFHDRGEKVLNSIRAQLAARATEVQIAAVRSPGHRQQILLTAIGCQPDRKTLALLLRYQFIPPAMNQERWRRCTPHEVKWGGLQVRLWHVIGIGSKIGFQQRHANQAPRDWREKCS